MIKVCDVCKVYAGIPVLQNVSLDIARGDIYGLLGASGAGKSTLLRCLNGLELYDQGSIHVDGIEIGALKGKGLRNLRKKMSMIFQDYALLERLSVFDNVFLPLKCWGDSSAKTHKKVLSLLDMVGLVDKAKMYPMELSGGQKQRVAIARALSLDPKIILCDEATSALDPVTADSILRLLKQVNQDLKITLVIVTHQMEVVKKICNNLSILEKSLVSLTGSVASIFSTPPAALERLMGTSFIGTPHGKTCFSFFYPSEPYGTSILSDFSAKTCIPYDLLHAQTHDFGDKKIGQLHIAVDSSSQEQVSRYFVHKNIDFTIKKVSEDVCEVIERV